MAALLLAAPVRSAVVAPTGSQAWVAPVAGVFAAVGAERIGAMGMNSLTALSTLDVNSRYPFSADPKVLDLLAKNLKLITGPDVFSELPTEDKLAALQSAAKAAELEAAAIADKSLAEAQTRPFHPSSIDRVSEQVSRAEDIALYLDASRGEEVARARGRIASFQSKWRKMVEKFHEDLPYKIAAGAFDAENVLVKKSYGWVAADESPYPIETRLSKFYERRIATLRKAPQGPWTIQEADLLIKTLDRPDIGNTARNPAHLKLKVQLGTIIASARENGLANRSLVSAIRAFEKNAQDGSTVASRHILTVEKHYDAILNYSMLASPSTFFRMLASIRNGAGGLPSWTKFQEIELATYKRLRRASIVASGALIAGVIAGFFANSLIPSLPPIAAFLLIWLAPVVVYAWAGWRAQSIGSARSFSQISDALRRYFPKD